MLIWWICCALLAAEPAMGDRVTFLLDLRPPAPGLKLAREPRALVLQRDGLPVDRLALPVAPKKAQRKDDHALLALGSHGLWIVRLLPAGRLVVVARHRLARPVDGFFFEGTRVIPTAGGRPIPLPKPPPVPPVVAPPSRETAIWPVKDRLKALPADQLRRMHDWPEPVTLSPPVSSRPKVFFETSFLQTLGLPVMTTRHDLRNLTEILVRVGYHVTPNHVVGLTLCIGDSDYDYHALDGSDHDYHVSGFGNPSLFFYRYSMEAHPFEVQLEPLLSSLWDSRNVEEFDAWGFRVAGQWVRRGGPMRFGLEVRLDLFLEYVQLSVALIYGINF